MQGPHRHRTAWHGLLYTTTRTSESRSSLSMLSSSKDANVELHDGRVKYHACCDQ